MEEFWKEKPRQLDFRAYSLLIPAAASAIGFFLFAILAFSFTELQNRRLLVIVGAVAIAFGGEVGTLSTAVEVHRKQKKGTAEKADHQALTISKLATAGEMLIAFATLLGTKARWGQPVQEWGVILLGILAMFDAYTGFQELGFYLGEYDERVEAWKKQRDAEAERLRAKQERREDRKAALELRLELEAMQAASPKQDEKQDEVALPFQCPHCERAFAKQAQLSGHQKAHRARTNGKEPAPELEKER
ncbi:MAG: C2H2-type zinc finger protein [Chloroflexota bacterium]